MQIKRENLLTILELLQPGLARKAAIQQSDCFVFTDGCVLTFNDELAFWHKSPLKIECAIVAKPLLELLRRMVEDDLRIILKKGQLRIIGKRKRAKFFVEKEIALPVDSMEKPTSWHKLHESFSDAIQIVEQCAGTDEDKFHLTCVHITPKYVEASDGICAARFRLRTGFESDVLVKRDSIRQLIALGMTKFSESENWLHFKNPAGLVMSVRRWVDDYEELREALKVSGNVVTLPKGLAEAAGRASIAAAENVDGALIVVGLTPGKILIEGAGSNFEYSEEKDCQYKGAPLTFTISPKLLAEIVQKNNKCEITKSRLKIDGGKYTFVTCLGAPDDVSAPRRKGKKDHGKKEKQSGKEKHREKEGKEDDDE